MLELGYGWSRQVDTDFGSKAEGCAVGAALVGP